MKKFKKLFITFRKRANDLFKNRDIEANGNRDSRSMLTRSSNVGSGTGKCLQQAATSAAGRSVLDIFCPFCSSEKFVKRGTRKKKLETIQLYLCKECNRTFTPGAVKGKHYPLPIILDAISLYHLGYSLEQAADIVNKTSCSRYCPNLSAYSSFPKEQGDIANNKAAISAAGRMAREIANKKEFPKPMDNCKGICQWLEKIIKEMDL